MASTPALESTALAVSAQSSMKGTATKFIGAVEDEWQLFRFAHSASAKTMHVADALPVTVLRTTPSVHP